MRIELTDPNGKKVLVRTSEIYKVVEVDEGCVIIFISGNKGKCTESFRQVSDMLHYLEGGKL